MFFLVDVELFFVLVFVFVYAGVSVLLVNHTGFATSFNPCCPTNEHAGVCEGGTLRGAAGKRDTPLKPELKWLWICCCLFSFVFV